MYEFQPVTERITRMRERYRTAPVILDAEHARIVTEAYQANEHEVALIKRARTLYEVCKRRTLRVEDDELIAGNIATNYRGTSIWPEYGMGWLIRELDADTFDKRGTQLEHMLLSEEDRDYYRSIWPYWKENSASSYVDRVMPPDFQNVIQGGVLPHRATGNADMPTGHFSANYKKVIEKGFGAIRAEAQQKVEAMSGRIFGDSASSYIFYQSIVIVCDAAILLSKRYAQACRDKRRETTDPVRAAELDEMADSFDRIMEQPCQSFHDVVQATYLYQLLLTLDGSLHGISYGRFDQYAYPYLRRDLDSGRLTKQQAQELIDCFFLKICEMFKARPETMSRGCGGYTSGQQMSLGGVDRDGNDATNELSYMLLEASARLVLHSPPLSLRVHSGTPKKLWECAVETTRRAGGIPTFQSDDVIIPMMMKNGFTLEEARDYCIIGCVEPGGSGNDFTSAGGPHAKSYLNLANCVNLAVNNGVNPMNGVQAGLKTGYLYEMQSFDEVKDAYRKQVEYFVDWHVSLCNLMQYVTSSIIPLPIASATIDGCMESGRDVTNGGALHTGCGSAAIACATVGNSLAAIRYAVFDKKICTARELYDAWMANWEGYEPLRLRLQNEAPKYGNGDREADLLTSWAMDIYAEHFNHAKLQLGQPHAGMFSVSSHIPMGQGTFATLDGRRTGTPLSDGISPVQGSDRKGPTAVLAGAAALRQDHVYNGTLLNMKFHPRSVAGQEGLDKLEELVNTYFKNGGMHIQYNIIGSDTLRDAQKHPERYRDLVIRIAGFSAYFVELYKDLQDDLISRTDQEVG